MKRYVVVYVVCGTHYRYRCYAENARQAKRFCRDNMGVGKHDIVETYIED